MLRFFTLVIVVLGLAVVVGIQEKSSVKGPAAQINETFIERATRTRLGEFKVERSID